jgi:hypothetical protein
MLAGLLHLNHDEGSREVMCTGLLHLNHDERSRG